MKKILMSTIMVMLLILSLGLGVKVNSYTVPANYELDSTEFRAAWVTPFIGDMAAYSNEIEWKKEVAEVIEIFKYYNLNAMIYHVRTHNNAFYESELNPRARWFASADYSVFDPLEYLIDECHKAGIEFHAWMNPYRVSTATSDVNVASQNGQNLASGAKFPSANPASDPANLIAGSGGVILNPGLPNVRDFIVDTCMEVIEKYNVDAIHFDDYFYISGSVDDTTYAAYNPNGLSKDNWRRLQVDLFIEQLHNELTTYNVQNNRNVQFGISPSGVYKDGSGSTDPNSSSFGSNTNSGFEHYNGYLYSDTYKWAKEGWIDYLLPQSYWALNHPSSGYANLMDWWDGVFADLDCLLYSGIGLYMAAESGKYGWSTDTKELANQLKYIAAKDNVAGYSIFNFRYMREAYNGSTDNTAKQLQNAISAGCFKDQALVPEIKNMTPIVLDSVSNFQVNGKTLTWDKLSGTKFYVIYRSSEELTYHPKEIVDVVSCDTTTWTDSGSGTYNYDVCPLSATNTVGGKAHKQGLLNDFNEIKLPSDVSNNFTLPNVSGVTWSLKSGEHCALVKGNNVKVLRHAEDHKIVILAEKNILGESVTKEFEVNIKAQEKGSFVVETNDQGTEITDNGGLPGGVTIQAGKDRQVCTPNSDAPSESRLHYDWTSSDESVVSVSQYGTLFAHSQGTAVIRGTYKEDPTKWGEITIYVYEMKGTIFTVTFKDEDGTILDEQVMLINDSAIAPEVKDKEIAGVKYIFRGWDKEFSNVTSDLVVTAQYTITNEDVFTVTFKDNDGTVLKEETVIKGANATAPIVNDKENGNITYIFQGWDKEFSNVTSDLVVTAKYTILNNGNDTIGDIDNNNVVNADDAIHLLMYSLFPDTYEVSQDADFNKDGKINSDDAIYLLMHTLFQDDYPLV